MKLRHLKLHGFKSFADSTKVDFHDGITCVVGPNGCGKSNISDAIRWVLGEQRPSAIRGGKMEEAIFQGSIGRRPVNRGSVSLTVSNEEGSLPIAFQEVEIGRTVYRDGGSEYTINRSTCRLRDVVDLYRDTGLGANAYSVIESRMIDAILSDRAEERRSLFEEAAGVGKYKDRRKAATRRLERAEIDLQRLEDVIAEVQTKVRSLARQKGRAQRYLELRARRLDVEVAVIGRRLEGLQRRLGELDRGLDSDGPSGEVFAAELSTAEAEYETLRAEQIGVERARSEAAGQLESVRGELVRWERELAVAAEREGHARRRLEHISAERTDSGRRRDALATEIEALQEVHGARSQELAAARAELDARHDAAEAVRTRVVEARAHADAVEQKEREIVRRLAVLGGDREAAEAQATDLTQSMARLRAEIEGAASLIAELQSQGDLFTDQVETLTSESGGVRARVDELEAAVAEARNALQAAREEEVAAAEKASGIKAEINALERLEQAQEGVEPAAKAALAQNKVEILGRLLDYVSGPPELIGAVESLLGPLAQGLVVQTSADAAKLSQWFRDTWGAKGGLYVLPVDRAPDGRSTGSLAASLDIAGPGAGWVHRLIGTIDLVDSADEVLKGEGTRISVDGASLDERGVLRLGRPQGTGGVHERKARLTELKSQLEEWGPKADAARARRSECGETLDQTEQELATQLKELRSAEDRERQARSEFAARSDERTRAHRHREELARQLDGMHAAEQRARTRAREAEEERVELVAREETQREDRDQARAGLAEVQLEWERARGEEAELQVAHTRLESEVARVSERMETLAEGREGATARIEALDREETVLRAELAEVEKTQADGEREMAGLFSQRDEATELLRERDAALQTVQTAVREAETRVRQARAAERQATEQRHQMELERQEVRGKIELARDRLETEWGKSFDELAAEANPVEEDPESLEAELTDIVTALARIGPVNMLAVEEHEEESTRLAFLQEQCADLISARDDLRAAIKQINETATTLFFESFNAIRENFQATFQRLFQGGEADLWLADAEDPLESPIEIHASPRGKKTQRIDLLSGGERALTALSLLFGIYLVKPSPFCVLDEVDAPLDESNIGRFIRLLQDFKDQTQFVVITHNPRTIEAADWIYGVTMEEPGVSTIVGVRLEEALQVSGNAA